jgi:thiol-disulfide isomerase/thioredoxin
MNKINAHAGIGDYYRYADMDEKILEHENKILDLAKKFGPDERKTVGQRLVESYINLAPVYGNRGEADQALAMLRKGLAELAEVPNAKERINEAMQSYLLVGQPAAPIEAEYWINAEPGTRHVDLRGQVTLLQFTAHWCGPCRKSYPAMLGFHERYAKDGLRVMFVTNLYGFFEKQSNLKLEDELAANKNYYVAHHRLPFQIAVKQWKKDPASDGNRESGLDANEARYFIGGYPTIVVIDKQGIIRLMMYGWDPANESKLARLIEKLLAESVANSKL